MSAAAGLEGDYREKENIMDYKTLAEQLVKKCLAQGADEAEV